MSDCLKCGQSILWVKMESGKFAPCNPGTKAFILRDSKTKIGKLYYGFQPHQETCTIAKQIDEGYDTDGYLNKPKPNKGE